MPLSVEIRVRPGAAKNRVGGAAGEPPRLVVTVQAPAVDGKANLAVLKEIAKAFDVRSRECVIVFGELHRDKRILIQGDQALLAIRLSELLGIL